jgi:hypothetical protein
MPFYLLQDVFRDKKALEEKNAKKAATKAENK